MREEAPDGEAYASAQAEALDDVLVRHAAPLAHVGAPALDLLEEEEPLHGILEGRVLGELLEGAEGAFLGGGVRHEK
jgi:hypothetical protein